MTTPTPNPTVPWAIGGGADNAIEHARMIPYAIFQGSEGVLGNTDLEIRALTVPGGSIRMSPGGYVVRARGLGQTYEAYMGKYGQEVTVPVDPNNTASARSDLVMLRIEDSHVAGEPWEEADLNSGPYRSVWIEKGVPSTTRSVQQLGNTWSAIPLARIDIPAMTSTITQAMIVPLRTKCSPPSPPVPPPTIIIIEGDDAPANPDFMYHKLTAGPSSAQNFASASINTWRQFFNAQLQWLISIPAWATTAEVILTVHNCQINEDVWGEARVNIDNGALYSSAVMYDFNYHGGPGPEHMSIVVGSTVAIPSAMRGKNKKFTVDARSLAVSPTHTGTITLHRGSLIEMEITFKEQT